MATRQQPEGKSLADLAALMAAPVVAARGVAKAISDSPGAAPLHAAVRQGVDEVAQALVAFPAQGVQPVAEMGQLFEPTPAEADRQLTGKQPSLDALRGIAAENAAKPGKEVDQPSQDRSRGM